MSAGLRGTEEPKWLSVPTHTLRLKALSRAREAKSDAAPAGQVPLPKEIGVPTQLKFLKKREYGCRTRC
jgi:hypothetical protein